MKIEVYCQDITKLIVIGANQPFVQKKKLIPFRFQQHHFSNYSTINTVDEDGRKEIILIF